MTPYPAGSPSVPGSLALSRCATEHEVMARSSQTNAEQYVALLNGLWAQSLPNLWLFAEEWAYLHRNLSGKYRVVPISHTVGRFAYLKSENLHSLPDGVYIFADEPRRLTTMLSDVDLTDFFFANGGFRGTSYEALSYITDDRRRIEATDFATPPTPLPESETAGRSNLDVQGHSFGNLPQRLTDYESRKALEDELMSVLKDDRHPMITLSGRGGTGKTSLALESLHRLADAGTFFALV